MERTTITLLAALAAGTAHADDKLALRIDRGAAFFDSTSRPLDKARQAAFFESASRHLDKPREGAFFESTSRHLDRVREGAFLESTSRHIDKARELALQALGFIGIRYKYGGSSPDTGFDCSGLVGYVASQALGLILPRDARGISEIGAQVRREELQPGDLVFFNTSRKSFSHVGIYVGDRRFIHAPASGGTVELVDMREPYWQSRYDGARRLSL